MAPHVNTMSQCHKTRIIRHTGCKKDNAAAYKPSSLPLWRRLWISEESLFSFLGTSCYFYFTPFLTESTCHLVSLPPPHPPKMRRLKWYLSWTTWVPRHSIINKGNWRLCLHCPPFASLKWSLQNILSPLQSEKTAGATETVGKEAGLCAGVSLVDYSVCRP